jgi:hypothetical protein
MCQPNFRISTLIDELHRKRKRRIFCTEIRIIISLEFVPSIRKTGEFDSFMCHVRNTHCIRIVLQKEKFYVWDAKPLSIHSVFRIGYRDSGNLYVCSEAYDRLRALTREGT